MTTTTVRCHYCQKPIDTTQDGWGYFDTPLGHITWHTEHMQQYEGVEL